MNERNPKGVRVDSNYQLMKDIEFLQHWLRGLDRKIEDIEEYLYGPKDKPQSEKRGLEKFVDE